MSTTSKRPTLAQIREWPATVDVPIAASALGISRSSAYEAIKTGVFPAKVLTVQGRRKVITSSLVRLLEDDGAARPARA